MNKWYFIAILPMAFVIAFPKRKILVCTDKIIIESQSQFQEDFSMYVFVILDYISMSTLRFSTEIS